MLAAMTTAVRPETSAGPRSLPVRAQESERIVELDALRGLAALAVALYHFTRRYDELYGHAPGLLGRLPWGHYGVQQFFVISGYVILMSLRPGKSAGAFALQRAARLYPPFWAACAATWLGVFLFGLPGRAVDLKSAALNLTMAPLWFKWLYPKVWYIDGAYWSLKEELVFYATMALVLLVGLRRHALWVVAGLAGLHLAGIAAAKLTDLNIGAWLAKELGYKDAFNLSMAFTLRWFSLFGLGMVIYESRQGFKPRHAAVLAILLLDQFTSAFWVRKPGIEPWQEFAAACISGLAVWWATHIRPSLLRLKPLVFLGAISYSFYLLHQNLGYIVIRECEERGIGPNGAVCLALLAAMLLATALAFGVERPVYAWVKTRIKPRAAPGG